MEVRFARYTQASLGKFKPSSYTGYKNGEDNEFPDYLDGLYNASVTHQAIINDYTSYILGKGLRAENANDQAIINKFFPNRFVSKLVLFDLIQNTKAIEVIKDNLYNIQELNILLPKQFRVVKIEKGEPSEFLFRQSWKTGNSYYNTQQAFQAYSKNCQLTRSLFWSYDSGTFDVPYGRPYYMSGLNAIEMEAGIYLMHNHGVQQGMFPSMIIDRETAGGGNEDDTSTAEIVRQMAGAAAAGKVIDIKRPQGSSPLNIQVPASPGIDKVYNQQYQSAEAGISKAHGLTSPTLIAGLNIKPTGFGDAEEEMQWALNQLKAKKIEPYRTDFLRDLRPLFEDLGIVGEVTFVDEVSENQELSYDSETIDVPKTNSIITNISGRQMQAIERLVRKYKKGQLNYEQAALMLKNGYGFNENEIKVWLNDIDKFKSLAKKNDELQNLIDLGQTMADLEGYEIYSVEDAGSKEDEKEYLGVEKFVSTGTARPNSKSNQDGSNSETQYKIRYRYAGAMTGERPFCNRMLSANKLYRYEDIVNMSFSNANPGFGINGANNYDIFSYKGGPNCKHKWERVTFVKKGLEGSIDTRSPLAKEISDSAADARGFEPTGTAKSKDRISQTRPFDMPKRGYFSSIKTKLQKWL